METLEIVLTAVNLSAILVQVYLVKTIRDQKKPEAKRKKVNDSKNRQERNARNQPSTSGWNPQVRLDDPYDMEKTR